MAEVPFSYEESQVKRGFRAYTPNGVVDTYLKGVSLETLVSAVQWSYEDSEARICRILGVYDSEEQLVDTFEGETLWKQSS